MIQLAVLVEPIVVLVAVVVQRGGGELLGS